MGLLNLIRPKWRHSEADVRKTAIEALADPATLAKVALTEAEPKLRRMAVAKLTDQEVLAVVARTDADKWVRQAAVKRVDDQAVLAQVVGEEKIKDVQLAAVRNLKDQVLIAELIDSVSNVNVKKRLIASFEDPEKLIALATGHMDAGIRMAAVKHCRDIETLTALATKDTSSGVRMTAVKQLDDDTLLQEIATRDSDKKVRLAAANRIKNPDILAKIVQTPKDLNLRLELVPKLDGLPVMVELAERGPGRPVREAALGFLSDPEVLMRIASGESDDQVLKVAICRLVEVLGSEVCAHISEEDLMTELAIHAPRQSIRLSAAKAVTDPARCRRIDAALRKRAEVEKRHQERVEASELQQLRAQGSMVGRGCPFYDNRLCVPPVGGPSNASPCSLLKGAYATDCHVYPIHLGKQERGY